MKTQALILVFDLDNTLIFRDQAIINCIEYILNITLSSKQKEVIFQKDEQGHSDRILFCKWLTNYLNIPMEATLLWALIKEQIGRFVNINLAAKETLAILQKKYTCLLLTNGGTINQRNKINQTVCGCRSNDLISPWLAVTSERAPAGCS